ncbi:hypothetical protein [Aequorivita antarctica]|uniref:Type II secretion system protein n=1 Tax=Aequorivita antarctica TaxID=153266 RepID=A0A5C6YZZ8_9FLAO|nr:hypothetical protein [Aequorivita antarctica]TXD72805.1 hypothetical protein ESU54_11350 [Aequorivita antarctica]SRX75261.1 hypothetical protein AEQU3_02255 [Aequorivita antarctica]
MRAYYKIKGSSLIETVIAITIITICSLIATLVYSRIIDQTPPIKKYEWSMEVSKLMEETSLKSDFIPFNREYKDYSIAGRLSKKEDGGSLSNIEFLVISQKDTVILPMLLYKIEGHEN